MKGQIIDISNSEAFVALQDDTIIRIPLVEINGDCPISSTINITSVSGSYSYCNNHKIPMNHDNLTNLY